MPSPHLPGSRSAMTLPIPLVPLPAAGAGQPPPPGPVLILTRPAGLALAALPGHGRQPGPPDDYRSGLWLRNAAVGLGVLAAAAAAVSFTAQYRMADAARHLPPSPRSRRRSPMLPPWCSPAWASRWPCTAAAPCAPAP